MILTSSDQGAPYKRTYYGVDRHHKFATTDVMKWQDGRLDNLIIPEFGDILDGTQRNVWGAITDNFFAFRNVFISIDGGVGRIGTDAGGPGVHGLHLNEDNFAYTNNRFMWGGANGIYFDESDGLIHVGSDVVIDGASTITWGDIQGNGASESTRIDGSGIYGYNIQGSNIELDNGDYVRSDGSFRWGGSNGISYSGSNVILGSSTTVQGNLDGAGGTFGNVTASNTLKVGGRIDLPASWDNNISGRIDGSGIHMVYAGGDSQSIRWGASLGQTVGEITTDSSGLLINSDFDIDIGHGGVSPSHTYINGRASVDLLTGDVRVGLAGVDSRGLLALGQKNATISGSNAIFLSRTGGLGYHFYNSNVQITSPGTLDRISWTTGNEPPQGAVLFLRSPAGNTTLRVNQGGDGQIVAPSNRTLGYQQMAVLLFDGVDSWYLHNI